MSETQAAAKGICALALGIEHSYSTRPHRRKFTGRIGSQARKALYAAAHERRRETDWAVNRPERCVFVSSHLPWLLTSSSSSPFTYNSITEPFPLASIFKRMSDVPDLDFNVSQDFTAAYKVSSGSSSFLCLPALFFFDTLVHCLIRNIPFTERCR